MDAHCQAKTKKKKNVATAANTTTTPMIDDEPRAMDREGGGVRVVEKERKIRDERNRYSQTILPTYAERL